MRILGIETSCDESSAAVVESGRRVLSNVVASQEELHVPYGGVVPEIACRAHLEAILPTIESALRKAKVRLEEADALAVVYRPGLIGSLLIGLTAAKTLAWACRKPLIGVDHIRAHLYASALGEDPFPFPAVGLVVSGGHTSMFHCRSPIDVERLGATTDDAAGEAFDKVANLLNLGYPGGPVIDRVAREGDPDAIRFPRSYLEPGSLDFSFSGLKTAVLYHCRGMPHTTSKRRRKGDPRSFSAGAASPDGPGTFSEKEIADIAASFQEAVVDVLVDKALDACRRSGETRLIVGGGVACNSRLRERLAEMGRREGIRLCLPERRYCPDNAAMVAGVAHPMAEAERFADLTLDAQSR